MAPQRTSSALDRELVDDVLAFMKDIAHIGLTMIVGTAQLIQVSAKRHLWAQSFKRDLKERIALQDSVVRAIAG
jgi:ABC-type polar amino acid transport system ATPase subunit